MARKGDTPEYVRRMQKELFEVLAEARSREELMRIEPWAREGAGRHMDELGNARRPGAGHPSQGGPLELFTLVRRDTAGAGSCKTGNFFCAWDGDRLRGEGRQRWEADPERKASEFMPGIMESCWRRRGKRWGLCLGRAILKAEKMQTAK
jgi:hypothetical protein